jgi:hypothetical protein
MTYPGELTHADFVEVTISDNADGARLWVHADGKLIARIYRIGRIVIDDRRTNPSTSAQDDGDGGGHT